MVAVAGGVVFAADTTTIAALTTGKPLVRLVQQSAQSLANSTDAAILFGSGSEDIDTHNFHDVSTNTNRITPTVAGYYRLTGTVYFAASTAVTNYWANISKNGTIQAPRSRMVLPATASASLARSLTVSLMLPANGTTDYFELIGQQTSGAALNTATGGGTASVLECEFLRP
jgi:hypothetical protein